MAEGSAMTFQRFKEVTQFCLIVFGAGWGVYTFIYKDIIVPSKRPPAVTLAATLEELDRTDGMVLVRARLVVANRGEGKVWVPALWWNVYGESLGREDRTASQFADDAKPLLARGDEGVTRFSSVRAAETVASGRIPGYEFWYQPKDETVHEQLFYVPEGRFDVLQIFVDAYIFKSIDDLAPTRWDINEEGVLTPTLLLKQKGWNKDSSRVLPFVPADSTHWKATEPENAGQNFTTASLRIKPKAAGSSQRSR
jgi:hypothetical protein